MKIFCLVLVVAAQAVAQQPACCSAGPHSTTVSGTLPVTQVDVTGGKLQITLPPNVSDWILGLTPTNQSTAAKASVVTAVARSINPDIQGTEGTQYSPGAIMIPASVAKGRTLVIFLQTPAATQLTVSDTKGTVLLSFAAESAIVRNGAVTSTNIRSLASVFAELMRPAKVTASAGPLLLKDGSYMAHVGLLKSHLQTFVSPALPPGTWSPIAVRLRVDNLGNATLLNLVTGDPALTTAVATAVNSWRFAPFTVNGTAVAVTGILPLVAQAGGSFSVP